MHPLSDKDLDRLSREAAEQYDVEQSTSGWDKLEQKLNKQLPVKGKRERRRFLFFIWLFALLSGGGLLWMLTGTHSSQMITLKEGASEISLPKSRDDAADLPSSKAGTNKKNDVSQPGGQIGDETPQDDSRGLTQSEKTGAEKTAEGKIGKEEINSPIPGKRSKQEAPVAKSITPGAGKRNSPVEGKNSPKNIVAGLEKIKGNLVDPAATPNSPPSSITDRSDKNNIKDPIVLSEKKFKNDISTLTPDQGNKNENKTVPDSSEKTFAEQTESKIDSTSVVKKAAISKNKPGFQKGLQVGLVVAPDMSNVKFTNTDKMGYNVGIQLGYRLSQKWSVNTGIIYTKKNYTSQGKDFNPPKGSWIDNVKLDQVEGNCYMFDIPLNVRYDLNDGKSHRYFLSTGLSTYLMKKEEYHYHYQYSNGSPGYRYRSSSSSENHLLSVLNISAGFEKKLSNRFSLQAEPYLKIPLSGVGYGNLQLNSYGMYFLLKFHAKKR